MAGYGPFAMPVGTVGAHGQDLSPFFQAWQLRQQAAQDYARQQQAQQQFAQEMAFRQNQAQQQGQLASLDMQNQQAAGAERSRLAELELKQRQDEQAQRAEQSKAAIGLQQSELDQRKAEQDRIAAEKQQREQAVSGEQAKAEAEQAANTATEQKVATMIAQYQKMGMSPADVRVLLQGAMPNDPVEAARWRKAVDAAVDDLYRRAGQDAALEYAKARTDKTEQPAAPKAEAGQITPAVRARHWADRRKELTQDIADLEFAVGRKRTRELMGIEPDAADARLAELRDELTSVQDELDALLAGE